jgi:hypothetical protein
MTVKGEALIVVAVSDPSPWHDRVQVMARPATEAEAWIPPGLWRKATRAEFAAACPPPGVVAGDPAPPTIVDPPEVPSP